MTLLFDALMDPASCFAAHAKASGGRWGSRRRKGTAAPGDGLSRVPAVISPWRPRIAGRLSRNSFENSNTVFQPAAHCRASPNPWPREAVTVFLHGCWAAFVADRTVFVIPSRPICRQSINDSGQLARLESGGRELLYREESNRVMAVPFEIQAGAFVPGNLARGPRFAWPSDWEAFPSLPTAGASSQTQTNRVPRLTIPFSFISTFSMS